MEICSINTFIEVSCTGCKGSSFKTTWKIHSAALQRFSRCSVETDASTKWPGKENLLWIFSITHDHCRKYLFAASTLVQTLVSPDYILKEILLCMWEIEALCEADYNVKSVKKSCETKALINPMVSHLTVSRGLACGTSLTSPKPRSDTRSGQGLNGCVGPQNGSLSRGQRGKRAHSEGAKRRERRTDAPPSSHGSPRRDPCV